MQFRRAFVVLMSLVASCAVVLPATVAHADEISTGTTAIDTTESSPGPGYWLVARDGGVFSNGAADFHGSTGAIALNLPIVGIAATPTGNGYWMVASDGGIFSFGDAAFHGSTGAVALNQPIVGMAATPSGRGYWLVSSDGGIFAFGDAAFHGSTGAVALNRPIVGVAATRSGHGYWMVASDGGIFSFGDAAFHGSTGALALNQPIVGMAATVSGHGYWFVAADGGIFSFGDARFFGSTSTQGLDQSIVAMAASAPLVPAVVAPRATRLSVTTDPSPSTGGVPFGTQPVVHIVDAAGHTVTIATNLVTLAIVSPPAGVVLTCNANPVRAVAGVATFSGCRINRAGSYTLRARSGSLIPSNSTATVAVGAGAQVGFVQQPSSAVSLVNLATQPRVAIQDLGGNTVSTVNTGSVTLSITTPNTPGGALACTALSATYSNGIATFAGCRIDVSGTYRLHAVGLTFTTNSGPLNITAAGADHIGFTTQPSSTGSTGGAAFAVQPVVTVQDASNNTVTGDNSSVTLTITQASDPAGAALLCNPSTTRAVVAGVATFSGCRIDLASTTTYTLRADNGVLPIATSNTVDIDVGAATKLGFIAQPGASTGGTAFAAQPRVAVQDAGGNTVSGATGNITLTITQPSAPVGALLTCTTSTVRALVSGVTPAFTGCAIDLASSSTYTLLATDDAVGGFVGTSAAFAIAVGAATQLGFVSQPTASTSGSAFPQQPRVAVQDAGGNTVTSVNTGTITLTITQPSAPVGAALTCTTSNARAVTAGLTPAFAGCAIDLASTGTYTLLATDDAVGSFVGTSAAFAITFGAPTHLGFVTQPTASTGGIAFPQQPRVAVLDAAGNTVTNATGNITLTITQPSVPVGAALTCTTSTVRAITAGLTPTFTGCAIDRASTTTYTLLATDDAIGAFVGTSAAFAITIGAASKLGFLTPPNSSTGGVAFTQQPRVAVQDAGGNTVTSGPRAITLDITRPSNPTAAALTCTTSNSRTSVVGVATFVGCKVDFAGTYTLEATVTTGLTLATSAAFTISVGAVSQIVFSTQPSPSTLSGVAFAQQPVVTLKDAGGNTVTAGSSDVTLTITQPSTPAGAALTCTNASPLATTAGVSTFTDCEIDLQGIYSLQADIPGFTVTSGEVTIT